MEQAGVWDVTTTYTATTTTVTTTANNVLAWFHVADDQETIFQGTLRFLLQSQPTTIPLSRNKTLSSDKGIRPDS